MITLHQFRPAFGVPNGSPFCMKVETWLRMAGLEYQTRTCDDPRKNPKGKAPVITDDDGTVIADSEFIIAHLTKKHSPGLDDHLSEQDLAHAHAYRRMLEEGTYFPCLYSRWLDERGWAVTGPIFFGHLPPVLNRLVPAMVRKSMKRQLHEQGTGRHPPEEIYQLAADDLRALSAFLGDKPFFLGDQPSTIDATVYAFAANCLVDAVHTPILDAARSHPNLTAYCDRMKERYYSDWQPPK